MAAGNTYESIATNTLGSAAASFTFSSISGSYTDLVLVMGLGSSLVNCSIQVNSDTGTNYSRTTIVGDGTGTPTDNMTSVGFFRLDNNSYVGSIVNGSPFFVQFFNYSSGFNYKTMIGRTNNASVGVGAAVGTWRSTSAITSIKILADGGTFSGGSTFNLYGIKAA